MLGGRGGAVNGDGDLVGADLGESLEIEQGVESGFGGKRDGAFIDVKSAEGEGGLEVVYGKFSDGERLGDGAFDGEFSYDVTFGEVATDEEFFFGVDGEVESPLIKWRGDGGFVDFFSIWFGKAWESCFFGLGG